VWAALIRDLGLIIGMPVIIEVGMHLYKLQEKASDAQIKAAEAQAKVIEKQVAVVEAQNTALKDTQYDKALALLKSQKELFDQERTRFQSQLVETQKNAYSGVLKQLAEALVSNQQYEPSLERITEAYWHQLEEIHKAHPEVELPWGNPLLNPKNFSQDASDMPLRASSPLAGRHAPP
jgi:multidrug resistance efflux pump